MNCGRLKCEIFIRRFAQPHLRQNKKRMQSVLSCKLPVILDTEFIYSFLFLEHSAKQEIRKAMRHWRKHTCVKFHRKKASDVDYIRFAAEDG